ncbi:hypothetical protein CYD30_05080 [Kosakonia cowanii]|jgi:hypothetical protein|nr:hypothetical protein CYD30_05080 [Kosakonia cowanii]
MAGRARQYCYHATPQDKSDKPFLTPKSRVKTDNESVYKGDRNVHIEFLHGVTLCDAIAISSIRLANPA